jgi:hypothetical protein
MVNHLKRGKALRETLTLTDRVCDVSQSSQKSETSAESTDHGSQFVWYGHGYRDEPVLPSVQRLGSRKERMGQREKHATCLVPFESSRLNTGSSSQDVKGGGQ